MEILGIKLPDNWQTIAIAIVGAIVLWARSPGANQALNKIRKSLGGLLRWPEPDPIKVLEAETPEGLGARAAVLARLRARLVAKKATAATLKALDEIAAKIDGGGA